MKVSVKQYLLYSSVFTIFTEAFFFNYIIDWKLLYLIVIVNYFLLFRMKAITFNRYFLIIMAFFIVHGLIAYNVISIPLNFMISQIIGIAIIGTYFYNVIPILDKDDILRVYLKMSLCVAIIGYFFYVFDINQNDGRLQSIFKEPAHYVVVIIPACYYYLKKKHYLKFAVIFGTLIISNSSLGYIGCALMFIVPNLTFRRLGYLALLMPLVFVVFQYVYKEYPFFKMRVDDTYNSLNVVNTGKFAENTNLSSYVMIANIHIAKENIAEHPLGSGIGSHHYMFTQRYINEMHPPDYLRTQGKHVDNSFDANSLFTRVASEFGYLGIVFVIVMLIIASRCFASRDLYFAQGIFIYFLLKLFRDGHYFPPEFFFFVWLFYFMMKDHAALKSEK